MKLSKGTGECRCPDIQNKITGELTMNNKRINFNKKHYDSRNERLSDMCENGQISLDDTFETSCRFCYGCCTYRDAVTMSAYDIFRCSKELNISTNDFINQYCWINIGKTSALPVLQLKIEPKLNKCVLLKNGVCRAGNSRPTTCALFPLGRFMQIDETNGEKKVGYVFSGDSGCRKGHSYTVREWLETNGMSSNDEIFLVWSSMIDQAGKLVREIKKHNIDEETISLLHALLLFYMYDAYNTNEDFLPQLKQLNEELTNFLKELLQEVLDKNQEVNSNEQ